MNNRRLERRAALLVAMIGVVLGAIQVVGADQWRWMPLPSIGRESHAMAGDEMRGNVVMFGGSDYHLPARLLDDTWTWDGSNWTRREVAGPTARKGHAMVYDRTRGVVVLFGGETSNGLSGETWTWDGSAWALRSVPGPAARAGHAMGYDIARNVVVLFGGMTAGALSGETWEWDGAAWILRSTAGPSARRDAAIGYHVPAGQLVLFGGTTFSGESGQTWTWDGTAWTPRGDQPAMARSGHTMVYLPAVGDIFLFGGSAAGAVQNDLWRWTGSTWQVVLTSAAGRTHAAMAFDSLHGKALIVGGRGVEGVSGEAYEFTSNVATAGLAQRWASDGPTSTLAAEAIAFDSVRGVVVFCGYSGGSTRGIWEWDGSVWHRRAMVGPSGKMCFDSDRGVCVMVDAGRTWEWDGIGWTERAVPGPDASAYVDGVVYDTARRRVVCITNPSGSLCADVWEFDGTAWQHAGTGGPAAWSPRSVVYDAGRGTTVYIGAGTCSDPAARTLWEWNGAGWGVRGGLLPVFGESLGLFDAARSQLVVAGSPNSGNTGMVWAWDGSVFRGRSSAVPRSLEGMVAAYDSQRDQIFMFGPGNYPYSATGAYVVACRGPNLGATPGSRMVCRGGATTLRVTVSGDGPFAYQWHHGVTAESAYPIAGATGPELVLGSVVESDAGVYQCVVTSACGSVTTPAATVTVCLADFDCSGTVSVGDIFAYLEAWFASSATADVDGTPGLAPSDIFSFLGRWFSGC